MSDGLDRLEPWIGGILAKLEPGARRRINLKLARELRRANVKRIRSNVEPDGNAMAPRLPRSGKVRKKGRMFRKIGLTKSLRIAASADHFEVGFSNPLVSSTATTHHFGDVGFVGRTSKGRVIRTKYQSRRLLGFGPEDIDAITEELVRQLSPDG